ncbi:MAG: tetratricopeptide repeat protein [Chthoniobacteraceae bacterium]
MSQDTPKAPFITFYSFKGGVGRSMALINTAGILAGRGFRVLVIDLDLEAPGLSYLNPNAQDSSQMEMEPMQHTQQLGVVDLLCDAKERGKEADLFALSDRELAKHYTQPYVFPDNLHRNGSLHIMPAGKFDGNYAHRFDALNLHELYEQGLGEPLIRAFKTRLSEADLYDYVLVDSRTGFSDEAGICTRDLADYLIILSGLNRQNVEGTSEFLKALHYATNGNKRFQIILSPVPNGEDELVDRREAAARDRFEKAWGSKVSLSLQIPYHPQLALTEEPHIFRRNRGYLFDAYSAIERNLLVSLGHDVETLIKKINEKLAIKDYASALRELRHMIRLDEGLPSLFTFAVNLSRIGISVGRLSQGKSESDLSDKQSFFESITGDKNGIKLIEFVVDNLPLGKELWEFYSILDRLENSSIALANRLFERLVSAKSDDADLLAGYAFFLHNKCGNLDSSETYYQRAIEVKPNHLNTLNNYAVFLSYYRDNFDAAEELYKKALKLNPTNAGINANYGQLLAGDGRLPEAEKLLLTSIKHYHKSETNSIAESIFSLWLVSRLQGQDASPWERQFKFLVLQGFPRFAWNFDRMLKQAVKTLTTEELSYANALSLAFQDATKVADLDKNERWRKLEPLNPLTIRKKN